MWKPWPWSPSRLHESTQSCCSSAHPCYFHSLLCSVGIFVMTEGKQLCFMGISGRRQHFLNMLGFVFFNLKLNRALKLLASANTIKCLNTETFSLLAHYLGLSALCSKRSYLWAIKQPTGRKEFKECPWAFGELGRTGTTKTCAKPWCLPSKAARLHLPAAPAGSCPWAQRHGDTLQEWGHCTPLKMAQVLFSKGKEQPQSSTVSF